MPSVGARETRKVDVESRKTCTRCGMVGHLGARCQRAEKLVDKLGIEIEGYWRNLPAAKTLATELCGRAGGYDGSVGDSSRCSEGNCRGYSSTLTGCHACGAAGWEFQTRPGNLGESLRQLTSLYPDVTSPNCGMHVHMSFLDPGAISMLCSERFFVYFRSHMEAWGKKVGVRGEFWKRLANENQYCRANSETEYTRRGNARGTPAQIAKTPTAALVTGIDRYRQINFAAFDEHKTVEFRLLPMFQSASVAVSAVEALLDTVESYLAQEDLLNVVQELGGALIVPATPGVKTVEVQDLMPHTPTVRMVEIEPPPTPADARPGTIVVPRCYAEARLAEIVRSLTVGL